MAVSNSSSLYDMSVASCTGSHTAYPTLLEIDREHGSALTAKDSILVGNVVDPLTARGVAVVLNRRISCRSVLEEAAAL